MLKIHRLRRPYSLIASDSNQLTTSFENNCKNCCDNCRRSPFISLLTTQQNYQTTILPSMNETQRVLILHEADNTASNITTMSDNTASNITTMSSSNKFQHKNSEIDNCSTDETVDLECDEELVVVDQEEDLLVADTNKVMIHNLDSTKDKVCIFTNENETDQEDMTDTSEESSVPSQADTDLTSVGDDVSIDSIAEVENVPLRVELSGSASAEMAQDRYTPKLVGTSEDVDNDDDR